MNILKKSEETSKYLSSIIEAADINRKFLGFMPRGAYSDAIEKEKIWVAVDKNKGNCCYAGHLMFGGKLPEFLQIFQVYVVEQYRNQKIASKLIDELTKHAENQYCLFLRARVAGDLNEALNFWERKGFVIDNVDTKRISSPL